MQLVNQVLVDKVDSRVQLVSPEYKEQRGLWERRARRERLDLWDSQDNWVSLEALAPPESQVYGVQPEPQASVANLGPTGLTEPADRPDLKVSLVPMDRQAIQEVTVPTGNRETGDQRDQRAPLVR